MVERWPPIPALRNSRSQHELLDQDARIQRLLAEMNPSKSSVYSTTDTSSRYGSQTINGNYLPTRNADPLKIFIEETTYAVPTTSMGYSPVRNASLYQNQNGSMNRSNGYREAPPYDLLYPPAPPRTPGGGDMTASNGGKLQPPPYNQVIAARNRMHVKPAWTLAPARLNRSPASPSGRFLSYDDHQRVNSGNSEEFSCSTPSRDSDSPSPPENSRIMRNTARQASFIAAVQRNSVVEKTNSNCQAASSPPLPRVVVEQASMNVDDSELEREPPLRRRSRRSARDVNIKSITNRGTARAKTESLLLQHHRRTTVYGDQLISSSTYRENRSDADLLDQNQHDSCISMRRTRPKSYVLATESSPTGGAESTTSAVSQDDTSRELSSMGSMSSIDNSARSAGARLDTAYTGGPDFKPSSSHSLHKIMSIFNKDSKNRFRPKRSRTSLPAGRIPIPTIKEKDVFRQGWVKHQEIPVGKTIRRSDWSDYWAILLVNQQQIILSGQQPIVTVQNGEKILTTPPSLRVDVTHSVVDIAYDFLKDGRHVLRLLTQARTEHVMQLQSESDMLAWISSLQSIADSPTSNNLQTSCSAVSLASSTSLGHCAEDRNVLTNSASANQLIMHRYKAKSSQLHSPVTSKRGAAASAPGTSGIQNDHYSQPGTSKDGSSVENGEPSTPKSGRKWKKSKANKQGSGGSSSSSIPPQQSILGVKLSDCAMSPDAEENVPLVVQICVTVVETNGMDTVGIYRIPGNTAAVNALRDSLSQGIDAFSLDSIDQTDSRWRDVNVVSSLLKMFLRKLPEPLLTDKLYPFFIDANRISTHTQRLHKLRNLLRKLPRHHYCTLRYLIKHLSEVTKKSDVNKMETRNLALMFGPSIVRPSDDNMATMVTHMSDQCKIIETLIHYHYWMFNDDSPADDEVPEQHASETTGLAIEPAQYGVGMPSTVSASTFNDMHNLIRKANEDQAAALMNEGKGGKIKNMLRRNSRRDKSKSKLKIESTAPAATHPRITDVSNHNHTASPGAVPRPQTMVTNNSVVRTPTQQSSVDSAFLGNYQERDIDAEILSRQTISPLASTVEQSPSLESSLGSIPDTSRTDPGVPTLTGFEAAEERKRRQQDMYSARRIFIAGSAIAAEDNRAVDALASHTHHLNMANSPALEVLSEETREKIRKMQRKQNWIEKPKEVQLRSLDQLKMTSPVKDLSDAVSCTSDYSTTSSAPISQPLAVVCMDPPTSSDYASSFSDPSPCARNASASPRQRPSILPVNTTIVRQLHNESSQAHPVTGNIVGEKARCQQKIRLRSKTSVGGLRDPSRRHTLSDMDSLKEGRLDKLARWFGIRKSSPDVSKEEQDQSQHNIEDRENIMTSPPLARNVPAPPEIIKTSPAELTPASGDEQL